MTPLHLCRHRKEQNERGEYRCESPKVIGKYVPEDICQYCRCPDHELNPATWAEKAANLVAAVYDHIAAGLPRASQEEHDRRLATCKTCEHYDPNTCGLCKLCGCGGMKLWLGEQVCPLKKW